MIKTSIAGYIVLVLVIVILVFRHDLFATHPIGIAAQIASFFLMAWARKTLGWRSFHPGANTTDGELVTKGPYRFVRHPIYAAIFYFILVSVLSHLSFVNVLLLLITIGGIMIRVIAEEHFLFARYPEYTAYAARTKRIIPFIF